jgi:hypothetical protein
MVSMVTTFAVLSGFRSLRIPSVVVAMMFVISMAIVVPLVLSWGFTIVWAIILIMPLVRTMVMSILFLAVAAIGVSVSITVAGGPGVGTLIGLLLAVHDSGVFTTVHVSVVATFEELLEFEHVDLNHSVFLRVLYLMSLWLSEEHLFAKLAFNGQVHLVAEIAFLHVVQNLNPAVEEFFKPHVCRFASQAQLRMTWSPR